MALPEFLDVKSLVAFTLSDIDIGLLKGPDQETDKNRYFTVEEVRNQLHKTAKNMAKIISKAGLDENFIIPFK